MLSRRDLLGRMLGTIVVSGIPFIARERPLDMRSMTDEEIGALIWNGGKCPEVKGVYRAYASDGQMIIKSTSVRVERAEGQAVFTAKGLLAAEEFSVDGMGIVYRGRLVKMGDFSSRQALMREDTLYGTYTLCRGEQLIHRPLTYNLRV